MKFIAAGGSVLALLILNSGAAYAGTQTVQNPSNPTFTQLLGINNSGTIAGFDGATTAQGFTLTLPSNFVAQNYPASAQSMVTGINSAGDTVGIYIDNGGTTHGYTDIGGTFKTVDQPGTAFNQGLGINDSGETVGYSSLSPAGQTLQLAYSQKNGTFTNINALLPSNQNSQAVGINNTGIIVGFYMPTTTTSIGFEDNNGAISTIDPFASAFTQALGINNLGEIVGLYTDGVGTQHGYIDVNGNFVSFDPTGSTSTTINGLNDNGQIVGFFTDANANVIGFVATTPEPASFVFVGLGLLSFGLRARRRKLS